MSVDPSTERFEQAIVVLPEDIDLFDHVNNVVYVRWVQEVATAHWVAAETDAWKEAIGWVIVRHEFDYLNSAREALMFRPIGDLVGWRFRARDVMCCPKLYHDYSLVVLTFLPRYPSSLPSLQP